MAKTVQQLADEVFRLVERDQGKGFVSDGLEHVASRDVLFEVLRGHLWHSEQAIKKLRNFLRKYKELPPR